MPCSVGVVEGNGKNKCSQLERWTGFMGLGAGLDFVRRLRLVTERV